MVEIYFSIGYEIDKSVSVYIAEILSCSCLCFYHICSNFGS